MPKKKQHSRRKNFQAIPFNVQQGLLTLADETVLLQALLSAAVARGLFLISIDATWAIRGLTAGEGPINVGYAHDDLSVTEVNEALNAELSDPSDIIQRERARRPVRRAGVFHGLATNEVINNGAPFRTTLKFTIDDGHNIAIFALNRSGAALTTGAVIEIEGTIYGRWI